MPMCLIKVHYPNTSNWEVGDVVDISNPTKLIEEGKVELFIEPVKQEKTVVVSSKKKTLKRKNK